MLRTTGESMLNRYEMDGNDAERYYFAFVPAGDPPTSKGWPLVVAFHGGGSTPLDMARFCQLAGLAERRRFAVVYPSGSGASPEYLTWNAGKCCGHAARREVDDVRFAGRLLDRLLQQFPLDAMQVYATGMSNGGMFCYRWAAAMPERIAAIAPVAGCLAFDPEQLSRIVPVMHFHGTDDHFVPYTGGGGSRSLRQIDFPSVDLTLRTWTAACGLSVEHPQYRSIPSDQQFHNDRHLSVHRAVYAASGGVDQIVEVRIDAGGHTWPGQAPPLCFLGPTVLGVSAGELMWEFFRQFFCTDCSGD